MRKTSDAHQKSTLPAACIQREVEAEAARGQQREPHAGGDAPPSSWCSIDGEADADEGAARCPRAAAADGIVAGCDPEEHRDDGRHAGDGATTLIAPDDHAAVVREQTDHAADCCCARVEHRRALRPLVVHERGDDDREAAADLRPEEHREHAPTRAEERADEVPDPPGQARGQGEEERRQATLRVAATASS